MDKAGIFLEIFEVRNRSEISEFYPILRDKSDRPHYGQQIAVLRLIEELILKILTRRSSGLAARVTTKISGYTQNDMGFTLEVVFLHLLTAGDRTFFTDKIVITTKNH